MFCLDVVVVCMCVSFTDVFLLGLFLIQNVNILYLSILLHFYNIHIKLNLFYSAVYNATTLFIRSYTFTTCFGLNRPSSGISLFAKIVTCIYYSSYILSSCTVLHLCCGYVFADINQPTIHRDLIFTTPD
jgi:hypothetical protein